MGKKVVTGKPEGFNLYKDDAGRTIFYDWVKKQAYYIEDSLQGKFYFFSSRIITGFAIGYIVYYFFSSIPVAIFAGVASYLTILFFFRKMFLADLTPVDRFEKGEKQPLYQRLSENFEPGRIIAIIVVSYLLCGGTIYNVLSQEYDTLTTVFNYVLAAGAFIFGSFYIFVYINKKKNK